MSGAPYHRWWSGLLGKASDLLSKAGDKDEEAILGQPKDMFWVWTVVS